MSSDSRKKEKNKFLEWHTKFRMWAAAIGKGSIWTIAGGYFLYDLITDILTFAGVTLGIGGIIGCIIAAALIAIPINLSEAYVHYKQDKLTDEWSSKKQNPASTDTTQTEAQAAKNPDETTPLVSDIPTNLKKLTPKSKILARSAWLADALSLAGAMLGLLAAGAILFGVEISLPIMLGALGGFFFVGMSVGYAEFRTHKKFLLKMQEKSHEKVLSAALPVETRADSSPLVKEESENVVSQFASVKSEATQKIDNPSNNADAAIWFTAGAKGVVFIAAGEYFLYSVFKELLVATAKEATAPWIIPVAAAVAGGISVWVNSWEIYVHFQQDKIAKNKDLEKGLSGEDKAQKESHTVATDAGQSSGKSDVASNKNQTSAKEEATKTKLTTWSKIGCGSAWVADGIVISGAVFSLLFLLLETVLYIPISSGMMLGMLGGIFTISMYLGYSEFCTHKDFFRAKQRDAEKDLIATPEVTSADENSSLMGMATDAVVCRLDDGEPKPGISQTVSAERLEGAGVGDDGSLVASTQRALPSSATKERGDDVLDQPDIAKAKKKVPLAKVTLAAALAANSAFKEARKRYGEVEKTLSVKPA